MSLLLHYKSLVMLYEQNANESNKQLRVNIITYILAIILVNAIFLWIRHLSSQEELRRVTFSHIFFGTLQLIYVVPKLTADIKKLKHKSN